MKGVFKLILLIATITLVWSQCPPPEELLPCKCSTNSVECIGTEIRSIQLNKLGPHQFKTLNIERTSITTIEENSLGNATFDEIVITNNTLLETISRNFLNKTQAKEIKIDNNPKLTSDSILGFIKTFELTEKLEIINTNNLVEIPDNAFQSSSNKSKLSFINLNDNKIVRLGSNAFNSLPKLIDLKLKNNLISKLDDNSLTFANIENQKVTVDLSNNKLSEKSFIKSTFVKEDHTSIDLNLDNNSITTLPEESFKPFLSNSKNQLSLNSNKFLCDCSMKWIFDNSQNSNIVHNVTCVNKNNKNLFDLSVNDLNCQTKPSTTPKPTPIPFSNCPDKKLIDPCTCDDSHSIQCEDKDLKQLTLNKLEKSHFESLRIFNTSIVSIDDNALGNATFNEVYIEDNTLLETISDKVFSDQPLKLFMINYGNSRLKSSSVFAMSRNLKSTEELELNYGDIKEIPENAFRPSNGTVSKLFDLNLSNNEISRIGPNAFQDLDNLVDIQLQNNNISIVGNWLNFPPNPNKIRNIMLTSNQLTENSFNSSVLKSDENVFMRLYLENNMIKKLPENIFAKYFENAKNEIYLEGNKFECDCSMKWILDNDSKLIKLIQDLKCSNKEDKNIFSLTPSDLGCPEATTTTQKY